MTQDTEFVYRMEDVLGIYERSFDPLRPVVCIDETSRQLLEEIKIPLPIKSGHPERYDYQYKRNGIRNLFMIYEPLASWRHVVIKEQRRRIEWVEVMKAISDNLYPHVEKIIIILDNLGTHRKSAFYEFLPPKEAKRLVDRFEFHYTPVHASWLNMAEIELSVFSRQCLSRRLPNEITMQREVSAWLFHRNSEDKGIKWQFYNNDARIKLRHLYPQINP